jgi:hypothetical protein
VCARVCGKSGDAAAPLALPPFSIASRLTPAPSPSPAVEPPPTQERRVPGALQGQGHPEAHAGALQRGGPRCGRRFRAAAPAARTPAAERPWPPPGGLQACCCGQGAVINAASRPCLPARRGPSSPTPFPLPLPLPSRPPPSRAPRPAAAQRGAAARERVGCAGPHPPRAHRPGRPQRRGHLQGVPLGGRLRRVKFLIHGVNSGPAALRGRARRLYQARAGARRPRPPGEPLAAGARAPPRRKGRRGPARPPPGAFFEGRGRPGDSGPPPRPPPGGPGEPPIGRSRLSERGPRALRSVFAHTASECDARYVICSPPFPPAPLSTGPRAPGLGSSPQACTTPAAFDPPPSTRSSAASGGAHCRPHRHMTPRAPRRVARTLGTRCALAAPSCALYIPGSTQRDAHAHPSCSPG